MIETSKPKESCLVWYLSKVPLCFSEQRFSLAQCFKFCYGPRGNEEPRRHVGEALIADVRCFFFVLLSLHAGLNDGGAPPSKSNRSSSEDTKRRRNRVARARQPLSGRPRVTAEKREGLRKREGQRGHRRQSLLWRTGEADTTVACDSLDRWRWGFSRNRDIRSARTVGNANPRSAGIESGREQ